MDTQTDTDLLAELYSPIAIHLDQVERRFDQELRSELPFIESLCAHIRQYRGKMLRPLLVLSVARACGGVRDEHITLAAVLEMVHMATLIHDDILDEAGTRRHVPTLNAMSGNETSVLVGDYLISHAYHLCSSLNSQHASRVVAAGTNRVCEGELLQVHHRYHWDLSEREYLRIISRKTGALTAAACNLGGFYAGADAALVEALDVFGLEVGIAFQIVDDVLDLVGSKEVAGKTLGRDLSQGKPTLPIIHFLGNPKGDTQSRLELIQTRPPHEWIHHPEMRRSIDYAMSVAGEWVQSSRNRLKMLSESEAKDSLVALSGFILRRHR